MRNRWLLYQIGSDLLQNTKTFSVSLVYRTEKSAPHTFLPGSGWLLLARHFLPVSIDLLLYHCSNHLPIGPQVGTGIHQIKDFLKLTIGRCTDEPVQVVGRRTRITKTIDVTHRRVMFVTSFSGASKTNVKQNNHRKQQLSCNARDMNTCTFRVKRLSDVAWDTSPLRTKKHAGLCI